MKKLSLSLFAFAALTLSAPAADVPGASLLVDLLMHFDTNSDDKLDSGEWDSGVADGFDQMDDNGDGKLTADEIAKLGRPISNEYGAVAGTVLPALISKLVMTQDTDKDGFVTREEYKSSGAKLRTALDADKDGVLSREELLALPTKALAGS